MAILEVLGVFQGMRGVGSIVGGLYKVGVIVLLFWVVGIPLRVFGYNVVGLIVVVMGGLSFELQTFLGTGVLA